MRLKLLVFVWISLVMACGQEKTHAVYDTDSNPDDFPTAALDVIRQIEAGTLVGAEAITQAFGDLLSEHSDLLDRAEWRQTVDRMGLLFRDRADSLAQLGLRSYSLAAEYYQLGILARPDDSTLRRLSGLFGCWQSAKNGGMVNPAVLSGDFGGVDGVFDLVRLFMSGDPLAQQFFRTYLAPEIRKWAGPGGLTAPEVMRDLKPVDRALLVCGGLADTTGLGKLTSFGQTGIDLVAARITQLDSVSFRAEFYLRPHEPVLEPLKVYLRLSTQEGGAWPVEIVPEPACTSWQPGQIVLVTRTFEYTRSLHAAAVGLADFAMPRPNFMKPENSRSDLYLVPPSEIVLR